MRKIESEADFDSWMSRRVHLMHTIATQSREYVGLIDDILLGNDPKRHVAVVAAIDRLSKVSGPKIAGLSDKNLIDVMTKSYDEFENCIDDLDLLYTLVADPVYQRAITFGKSSSYGAEVNNIRNVIYNARDELTTFDDNTVFDFILPRCGDTFNAALAVTNKINKFTIRLIGYTIGKVSKEKQSLLVDIVEKQKDIVLGATNRVITASTHATNTTPIIGGFGLTPGPPMKFAEVVQFLKVDMGDGATTTTVPAWADVASKTHNILIIDRTSPSPITFDIAGLVDSNYVNSKDLLTRPLNGLSKRTLMRLDTFKILEEDGSGGSSDHAPIPPQLFPGKLPTYVILTRMGDYYRIMYHNTVWIHTRISTMSTRPEKYHELMNVNCIDPRSDNLIAEFMNRTIPSTDQIRTKIIDKLVASFSNEIESIKSQTDYRNFITPAIVSAAVMTTIHPAKNNVEINISYLLRMDTIITELTREIGKVTVMETLDRIFSEHSGSELAAILRSRFVVACTRACDELERSGVFATEYGLKNYVLTH